ncbi:MAG: hypothetical protein HY043_24685 [Verrucomicrobia bacterium]|nr:hypothetical protein [Verrucomicrobiota bacterium]
MSARLFIIGFLFLLGAGCRKQAASTAKESAAAKSEAASPADAAQTQAMLDELTQAVRKYAAEQQRVPKSLQEIVDAGYLNGIPAAPAEKKFAINKDLQVYLTQ